MRQRPPTLGTVNGLWSHLRTALGDVRDVPQMDVWAPYCLLVAEMPSILEYGFAREGATSSIAAGATVAATMMTVPNDERWRLQALRVARDSGDNVIDSVSLSYPTAYRSGPSSSHRLTGAGLAATEVAVPNGATALAYGILNLLLEPATIIQLTTGGVGVAASVFTGMAFVYVSKLVRNTTP